MKDIYDVTNQVAILFGVKIYDLGNRKLLYCFTGHSHWARAFSPFILCAYQRGQSYNTSHVCVRLTDAEYIQLINQASSRYAQQDQITEQRERRGRGPYDYKAHRAWCAEENKGVCNINSVPADYKISCIRLDVFHGHKVE